jgi:hypothetical protein
MLKVNLQYSHTQNALLILLVTCFIFIFSLLTISSPQKFTASDETIGKYFTERYAETGSLKYYEPLSSVTSNYARPRNTFSKNNYISPSTFPGFFIVYGTFGALSAILIPFLNAIVAAIGGIFMYILVRHIYKNTSLALLSTILLFTLPPYWIWSSTSYFNNIASAVFLLGGMTFFFLAIESKKIGHYIAMASCLGIECLFRTTDITYLLALVPIVLILRKKIVGMYILIAFIIFAFIISPVFILNKQLHGSFLSFGYDNSNIPATHLSTVGMLTNKISFFLLPSGFNIGYMISHSKEYILKIIPTITVFAILGISFLFRKRAVVKPYIMYFILISFWIIAYYGSGQGYAGSYSFTLYSSYTRYFLPIYIFAVPIAAAVMFKLPKKEFFIVLSILLLVSTKITYSDTGGISDIQQGRLSSKKKSDVIFSQTEKNSIIFTTLADKFLFPERKVVIYGPGYPDSNFSTNKMALMITKLEHTTKLPVYILNDREDIDVARLSNLLKHQGLKVDVKANANFLYKVEKY